MRWHYRIESLKAELAENTGAQKIHEALSRLGDEGWELVNLLPAGRFTRLVLKRPNDTVALTDSAKANPFKKGT